MAPEVFTDAQLQLLIIFKQNQKYVIKTFQLYGFDFIDFQY